MRFPINKATASARIKAKACVAILTLLSASCALAQDSAPKAAPSAPAANPAPHPAAETAAAAGAPLDIGGREGPGPPTAAVILLRARGHGEGGEAAYVCDQTCRSFTIQRFTMQLCSVENCAKDKVEMLLPSWISHDFSENF